MDIDIELQVRKTKKKRLAIILVLSLVVISAIIYFLRSGLETSIKSSAFTVGVVERGTIENTISASGDVVPEFEEIISSPIIASIQQIKKSAGSTVGAGESIISLDKSATVNELAKQQFQLEAKKNNIRKLRLELDKSFYDIKANNEIKQLRINSLMAEVENAKRLFKAGGGTREDIDKAELNLQVARLEKQQLENEIRSKQQTMQVEMRESEIEAAIQQNELSELQRKLNNADILTSRAGVITWVNKNIGAMVTAGEPLARIADLSGFKITGNVSDNFLPDILPGMTAIVRINEKQLRGKITQIYPSIQNGIVQFDVRLDSQHVDLLRPNLKVDVFLVTDSKNDVLRVENGAAFKGSSPQDVFVIQNGKAVRRKVATGMSNFDHVELVDNIIIGDKIIISDMSRYKNVNEITIIN
jgi:HlyD family secretion protein